MSGSDPILAAIGELGIRIGRMEESLDRMDDRLGGVEESVDRLRGDVTQQRSDSREHGA